MHPHYKKIMFVFSGLGLCLLYGMCQYQTRIKELKSLAPHGRYTAQEVLTRADQIYPRASPGADIRVTIAEFIASPHLQSILAHTWNVACEDSRGDAVTQLRWNADTGRLIQVSCSTPQQPNSPGGLTAKEATRFSRQWLINLGMANTDSSWRLARPPLRGNCVWHIDFYVGNEEASVVLDSRNAELVLARAW